MLQTSEPTWTRRTSSQRKATTTPPARSLRPSSSECSRLVEPTVNRCAPFVRRVGRGGAPRNPRGTTRLLDTSTWQSSPMNSARSTIALRVNMLPCLSTKCALHRLQRDGVTVCKLLSGVVACGEQTTSLRNSRLGERREMVRVAAWHPFAMCPRSVSLPAGSAASVVTVSVIIDERSQTQMCRVTARGVMTCVSHYEPPRNVPTCECPR